MEQVLLTVFTVLELGFIITLGLIIITGLIKLFK